MLTLRPGESVMVGDDVEVRVASFQGNKVPVAIRGPEHIRFDRKSVYLARNGLG